MSKVETIFGGFLVATVAAGGAVATALCGWFVGALLGVL